MLFGRYTPVDSTPSLPNWYHQVVLTARYPCCPMPLNVAQRHSTLSNATDFLFDYLIGSAYSSLRSLVVASIVGPSTEILKFNCLLNARMPSGGLKVS